VLLSLATAACASPAAARGTTSSRPVSTTTFEPTSSSGPGTSSTTTTQAGGTRGAGTGRAGVPAFSHVFVVMMENLGYSLALATPGFESLVSRYASASNYYAVGHPSLPNYLAITSGGTWGVKSDCIDCYVDKPNIGEQLSKAKISWGAYFEDVPTACYLAPYWGDYYAGKHNPFRYYDDIRSSRALCSHLVPYRRLAPLLAGPAAKVPRYVWVTPNLCDDGHNCAPAIAAAWLDRFVAGVVKSAAWKAHGVLFVTWDESDSGGPAGGQVLTLVISPGLRPGLKVAVPYTHYSVLATIEDAFRLPLLGAARSAKPMTAFWRPPGSG
jgi:phosphatidylinositol-3-phosphatase